MQVRAVTVDWLAPGGSESIRSVDAAALNQAVRSSRFTRCVSLFYLFFSIDIEGVCLSICLSICLSKVYLISFVYSIHITSAILLFAKPSLDLSHLTLVRARAAEGLWPEIEDHFTTTTTTALTIGRGREFGTGAGEGSGEEEGECVTYMYIMFRDRYVCTHAVVFLNTTQPTHM